MADFPAFFMKSSTLTCMGLVINFLSLVIDLNGVYIKIIKLAPNVYNSYLLIFIHKFILFALTTNAIYYVFIHVFIELCISIEFIGLVFIANFIYIYPYLLNWT